MRAEAMGPNLVSVRLTDIIDCPGGLIFVSIYNTGSFACDDLTYTSIGSEEGICLFSTNFFWSIITF
jgi:hypothetical protein